MLKTFGQSLSALNSTTHLLAAFHLKMLSCHLTTIIIFLFLGNFNERAWGRHFFHKQRVPPPISLLRHCSPPINSGHPEVSETQLAKLSQDYSGLCRDDTVFEAALTTRFIRVNLCGSLFSAASLLHPRLKAINKYAHQISKNYFPRGAPVP